MNKSVFAVGLFCGLLPATAWSAEPVKGDVAAGFKTYVAVGCFECHGRSGQGGGFLGPTPTLAHTELPLDAFTVQLRQPSNNMPTYGEKVLSTQEVADIYAYLQSVPGVRDIKTIPELLTR
jgi:mono/diheme cytochrome c family protein